MFVDDSKTRIQTISKRSSGPWCKPVKSPLFDTENGICDSSPPTLPVRKLSVQDSQAVKALFLELESNFLSELLQHDESIQDDFDDLESIGSSVSDITNPTTFRSSQRSDSAYSINTYSPEIEHHRPSSSSDRKDLPPKPVARQLTVASQDSFHSSVEKNSASSALFPPMSPPPRPFATGRDRPVESQGHSTTPERDEVLDNDTPPVPFLRRLTERTTHVDQICDDSSTKDSIQEQGIMNQQLVEVPSLQCGIRLRSSLRLIKSSESNHGSSRAVTFGSVDERVYERTPEMCPSTQSGASIGLGWNYEDKASVPISDDESSQISDRPQKDFLQSKGAR